LTEIDGEPREPPGLYVESLEIRRDIVTRFGASPGSLRDVSISLDRVADAMRGLGIASTEIDGEPREPLGLYVESLGIAHDIVTRFGASPESLRDVIVSLSKFVTMADDTANASGHLQEAWSLLADMRKRGWVSPQWEADVAWARG
ncbi:MAG: hypothetical protein KDA69_20165, partial [Planctomycetaceae bacterium]|nr:hypothetical protein [Planctomycetaceae bacterium]